MSSLSKFTAAAAVAFSVAAAGTAGAGSDVAKEAEQAGAKIDITADDNIAAGDAIFHKNCTWYCHGKQGARHRSPSLRNRDDLTVRDLQFVIVKGRKRAGKVMPAWGKRLKEEEIWQLVAYLVSLRDAGPAEPHGD